MDSPDQRTRPAPEQPPLSATGAAGAAAVRASFNKDRQRPVELTPYEQIAQSVCEGVLANASGYLGTYSFGTPGGNDLDLRLCFADEPDEQTREYLHEVVVARLRESGVEVDIDLLFMAGNEFKRGIRDLEEMGDVGLRLKDGFDPHERQAAVGDTSMFSLYIFSTMRELHRSSSAGDFGSPESALQRLELTREGALGWMHYYAGCFLHEYLRDRQGEDALGKYQERLAKFVSRVIAGSTLAQLTPEQLSALKPELIRAVQEADQNNSADANISRVLLTNQHTRALLDEQSVFILETAGSIRSGAGKVAGQEFIATAETRLFYEAFQQGIDRRPGTGEGADPLTGYALGELIRLLGSGDVVTYHSGVELMAQGAAGDDIMYIPVKKKNKQDNGLVYVIVEGPHGQPHYTRTPGRVVGEGALFGLPRSADVVAGEEPVEAYVITAQTIRDLLSRPDLQRELQQPLLQTHGARCLDVLLRYAAREAAVFTRQTLPYTTLGERSAADQAPGENPFKSYNLGTRFHDTLYALAHGQARDYVSFVSADTGQEIELFNPEQTNDKLYVVSGGEVVIELQNGEEVTLRPGEYFGESSLLGLKPTGRAKILPGGRVLAVDAQWFQRFTQSRRPIEGVEGVLPVHFLYHLAAEGYDRVRRRLITQGSVLPESR